MLNIQTGSSCNKDSFLAGKEAVKSLHSKQNPKLAFVYSSIDYDIQSLLQSISQEMPDTPIIGNSSFTGIITQSGFADAESGFVGIMGLYDDVEVGVASAKRGECAVETGRQVAKEALRRADAKGIPSFFYMSATPGYEEEYILGITDILGNIPCFGGSAADNDISGKWFTYTNEQVVYDGVSVAIIYTHKKIENKLFGFYEPTSNMGVITDMKDKRNLAEIDHTPALKKYRDWTGASEEELMGASMLGYSIFKPLAVRDLSGSVTAIRHPMAANEDMSITLSNNAAVGTAVIQMETTQENLIEAIGKGLGDLVKSVDYPIAGVHFVHCAGRKVGIADRGKEIEEQIKKVLGRIPFIVEFTFGEYGYEKSANNICAGLMLSMTIFEK